MSRTQYTIIGIHGYAGVGKDTLAERLKMLPSFSMCSWVTGFASPIREIAADLFAVDPYDRNGKEIPDEFWNKSPRQIMQLIGTECFRKVFGDDVWIKILEQSIKMEEEYAGMRLITIIPDVRFQNEADWIIESGGVIIHLTRQGYDGNVGVPSHASEAGIDLSNYSYKEVLKCANDSTIDSLVSFVIPFVTSYLIRKGH